MKKTLQKHKPLAHTGKLTPTQTAQFLHDFAEVIHDIDQPSQAISIRVPKNILNSFKVEAKHKGFKYQSLIVRLMRTWLKEQSKP